MNPNRENWYAQQNKEFELDNHVSDFEQGILHFRNVYDNYFKYLEIKKDLQHKRILEIGPANFPALAFCYNYADSYIIEPMASEYLLKCIYGKNIMRYQHPAEDITLPENDIHEVWLFNVLQHVIDPAIILNKCMIAVKTIRFFEPINQGIDGQHLHNFTIEYFEDFFKQKVNHFPKHQEIPRFHNGECAYGIIKL